MPFRLGPLELCIILVIILLIFGVGKLPQVGEAIGKSLKSFRDGSSGEDEEKPKRSEVGNNYRDTRGGRLQNGRYS